MTREWSIVITGVLELCDEKDMDHCDEIGMEPCNDRFQGSYRK